MPEGLLLSCGEYSHPNKSLRQVKMLLQSRRGFRKMSRIQISNFGPKALHKIVSTTFYYNTIISYCPIRPFFRLLFYSLSICPCCPNWQLIYKGIVCL